LLTVLGKETRATIDRLYPERLGRDPPRTEPSADQATIGSSSDAQLICAETNGYVQRVDVDALMRVATEHDLIVCIKARPGCFVTERDCVFEVHTSDRIGKAADLLRGTFVIGQERTPDQDLEFSIRRIVEIAQRALSPGINDPTTALYCIDRLAEAFVVLAARDIPARMRFDDAGRLRIVTDVISFDELACSAFAAIARYGIADADVVRRLLDTLDILRRAAGSAKCLKLGKMIDEIRRESADRLSLEFDRHTVQEASKPGVSGEAAFGSRSRSA
jgi:uncharacterized membrane protein